VTFRPTCLQALGRGGYLGGLVGLAAGIVMAVLVATPVSGWLGAPPRFVPFLPLVPLLLCTLVGGLLGLVFCRDVGADIDDAGICCAPRRKDGHTAWRRIEDLRAERRGGRTRVAVYGDRGQIAWLQAPYSGRFLATDPEFERKLFMLRNVLATHRSFALTQRHIPSDGS
jgi:hypothetical protein